MEHLTLLVLCLSITSLLLSPPSQATTPSGTIQTAAEPQTLASIPPSSDDGSKPFLASPSGNYVGYLLRRQAGGTGNGSCYVEVQDTGAEQSAWESECAAVGGGDACELVLSNAGLEVYGGSQAGWGAGGGGNGTAVLELADDGELRITAGDGVVVWKSGDEPRASQGCGLPGSAEAAPSPPSFSPPVGGSGDVPFGQPAAAPPLSAPVGGGGGVPFAQTVPGGQQAVSPGLGSAGAAAAAAPVAGGGSLPFGQPAAGSQQVLPPQPEPFGLSAQPPVGSQQQPRQGLNGLSQPFGRSGQPLVDNTPYDSGCSRGVEGRFKLGLFVVGLFYGLFF